MAKEKIYIVSGFNSAGFQIPIFAFASKKLAIKKLNEYKKKKRAEDWGWSWDVYSLPMVKT